MNPKIVYCPEPDCTFNCCNRKKLWNHMIQKHNYEIPLEDDDGDNLQEEVE